MHGSAGGGPHGSFVKDGSVVKGGLGLCNLVPESDGYRKVAVSEPGVVELLASVPPAG